MNPLSGVIGEAWQMYRAHAKHLLAIAFAIYLIAAIISAVLGLLHTVGVYLALLVTIFALFLLQATLVKAVQDVRDGRADLSIRETVSQAVPYIWRVAGASILAVIAIFVIPVALSVVIRFYGLILIIFPGLMLITWWAVFVPVIVIEGSGALTSFGRSRQLVRTHAWHVFGTLVLVWIILFVVEIILSLIFRFVPYTVRDGLASIISGTLVAPFIALVVTLMYYRLLGSAAPSGGSPYGAYQHPQDGGHGSYQQGGPYGGNAQPQGGGWQPPPQGSGFQDQPTQAGGWQQPPQGNSSYAQPPQGGGWQQPPQGGGWQDQPTQVGGWPQPPQSGSGYGGNPQPPQGGGWQPQTSGYQGNQPTQLGGYPPPPQGYLGQEPPTRMAPRPTDYQPPEDDDDNYGNR